jgi:hypothetical protein
MHPLRHSSMDSRGSSPLNRRPSFFWMQYQSHRF